MILLCLPLLYLSTCCCLAVGWAPSFVWQSCWCFDAHLNGNSTTNHFYQSTRQYDNNTNIISVDLLTFGFCHTARSSNGNNNSSKHIHKLLLTQRYNLIPLLRLVWIFFRSSTNWLLVDVPERLDIALVSVLVWMYVCDLFFGSWFSQSRQHCLVLTHAKKQQCCYQCHVRITTYLHGWVMERLVQNCVDMGHFGWKEDTLEYETSSEEKLAIRIFSE